MTLTYYYVILQAMHEGVVRDMEQQRIKRERQLDFELQRALEADYKREQTVHDTLSTPVTATRSAADRTPQSTASSR
jgi:hypothetical protein